MSAFLRLAGMAVLVDAPALPGVATPWQSTRDFGLTTTAVLTAVRGYTLHVPVVAEVAVQAWVVRPSLSGGVELPLGNPGAAYRLDASDGGDSDVRAVFYDGVRGLLAGDVLFGLRRARGGFWVGPFGEATFRSGRIELFDGPGLDTPIDPGGGRPRYRADRGLLGARAAIDLDAQGLPAMVGGLDVRFAVLAFGAMHPGGWAVAPTVEIAGRLGVRVALSGR